MAKGELEPHRWRRQDWDQFRRPNKFYSRTCMLKNAYETFDEAHAVAGRQSRYTDMAFRVYVCPTCGYYHLTKAHGNIHYSQLSDTGELTDGVHYE